MGKSRRSSCSYPAASESQLTMPRNALANLGTAERAALFAEELRQFTENFVRRNSAAFANLPLQPPRGGVEEQQHAWHDAFMKFSQEAELRLQSGAEKWGFLKEPVFNTDFVEFASHGMVLDDFLKVSEYPRFIEMVRKILANRAEAQPPPSVPGASAELRAIDERLAALEQQRIELLLQRRQILGTGSTGCSASLQGQIERQRYLDDVGMD